MVCWNLPLIDPILLNNKLSIDRHLMSILRLREGEKSVEISNSSLTISSVCDYTLFARGVAQLVSVPRLGRGGRRFESAHPDKKNSQSTVFSFIQARIFKKQLRHDHAAIHFDSLTIDIA